jgi:putative copper export protein
VILDLLLRWLHVISASILTGGLVFWWTAVAPAMQSLAPEQKEPADRLLRRRWGMLVGILSGLILASGLINAVRNMIHYQIDSLYHMLIAVKLIVALAVFYIAARLCGRSESARHYQQNAPRWLAIAALLSLLLVMIGGYLRSMDRQPKPEPVTRAEVRTAPALPADQVQSAG